MKFKNLTCGLLIALIVITSSINTKVLSQGVTENVVIKWNNAILTAIKNTSTGPTVVARALAIVHTCIYDAWAAYDQKAVGTRLGGALRRPSSEHADENKEKAISFAAYRALIDLFPTQKDVFDSLMQELGYDPLDTSEDTNTPTGIGNVVSKEVINFRHSDGSNQLGDLNPGAYSDYTNYQAANTPEKIKDPNKWQPLLGANGQAQKYLTPHWGEIIPFAIIISDELRPLHPLSYPMPGYTKQAKEVVRISAHLTDKKKAIAEYWAGGPGTVTPPGLACEVGQFISKRDNHSLDEDVKMFFILANALFDSSIAVWECKRKYDFIRPVSAIRFLFAEKKIKSWAGPGLGTKVINGQDWKSYIGTPPFPEHVSGHSTFSSASAKVFKLFTGSDSYGDSATVLAGSSMIEPAGTSPKKDITLSWKTFTIAAREAGISRLYGGIHFQAANKEGYDLGQKIGEIVWEKAQRYFDGNAE